MNKIFLLVFAVFLHTALLAQTIAFWDFNSNPNDANTATGTTTVASGAGTVALIGGTTSTFAAGATNDPNTTDNSGWQTTTYPAATAGNKTAGIQINVSTVGMSGISLSFYHRVSNTGAKHWTLQYTLDRTAGSPVWVDAQLFTNAVAQAFELRSFDFTAITGLNNNANVAFRFVATFDPANGTSYTAANAGSTYGTASTNRFDMLTVSATPPVVPYVLAFNRTNVTVNEAAGTAQVWLKVTTVGNTAGTMTLGTSAYSTATNPADYTVVSNTINVPTTLALNDSVAFTFNIENDANTESDEYILCKIANTTNVTVASTALHALYIKDNDRIIPTANNALNLSLLGSFSNGTAFSGATQINSAEISAYDALSKNIYIANSIGSKLDIVNFQNPALPTLISSIDITPYGAINSVAAKNGIIALAIENTNTQQDSGKVVFLDTLGVFIKSVNVGMMPDMIVFNHAGTKIYTANEAQPNESYNIDPDGSISIIDISGGVLNATVSHITFTAYNGQEAVLRAQGIRIYGTGATASKDFEPEYITISDDDTKAWVTLQENNALAELNLITNTITSLIPLGYKNHATVGNGMDASDQTAAVNIANFPVKGMYQPDAIAQYAVGGNIYLLTANEGDARAYIGFNEETRVGSLNLDATVFPNSADLKNNAVLGRLRTTNKLGDTDNDGDFDEIYAYGARSFSIWNGTTGGNLVYDSGSQIEEITANDPTFGQYFNFNSGGARKDRSDDKGPEPEGITTANINGHEYAFVGMERTGGVIVYDVTNPVAPQYVTYSNNRPTDLSPEGIFFIPENQSPNGKKLLVVSNEISSTITVYQVNPCTAPGIASIASIGGTAICPSGTLKLYNVNSNATYTYQWLKNNVAIANATDSVYFASQAGDYRLAVYNASGCVDTSAAITLTILNDVTPPTITAPANINLLANNGCSAIVNLGTPLTSDNCSVVSVTNDAPATFPIGTTTVTWTVTDIGNNIASATQTVVITDENVPTIYFSQNNLVTGITGPSSSATPYLTPNANGVKFTSLLTVGDNVGGYQMAGIPDGAGAFDNGNGTFTLLINHELQATVGATRAHGSIGSFVSKWIINKNTLAVTSGSDLIQQLYVWNTTTNSYDLATGAGAAIGRLCSGDLPAISAFYNPNTGLGTTERIFMSGEEVGAEGRTFAHIATWVNAGKSYQLPRLGRASWENAVASPLASNLTIVAETDDATPGQVYFYVGTKTNTGNEIEKAGLTNGNLYVVSVPSISLEDRNTPINGAFSLTNLGNVANTTGATLQTSGGTEFLRPEDGAWDPNNPTDFYFLTTDRFDQVKVGTGSQVGRSRLYRLRFTDIANPTLGGTIAAVLDGTEIGNMMDNMTIDKHGHVFIQEDPGNQAYSAKILEYDIATDQLTVIAKHDPARFGDIGVPATAPFNQDEESSGIIDVSDILGQGMHILVQQAHYPLASPLIEGGQLLAAFIPSSIGVTSTAADTITVCANAGNTPVTVNLGTPATADNCSVANVINNAPATFPVGTTTVTWTVTDASNNTKTANQTIIVNPIPAAPMLMASQDTVCAGTPVTLSTTPATGYTSAEYLWYKNDVAVNYQNGGTGTYTVSTGNTAGIDEYKVQVIYTGSTCLSAASDSVKIVKSAPNAIITPAGATTFCANTPTVLNANAGMANYLWKRSTTTVQSGAVATYTPTLSGNYSVTVTDANGCVKTSPNVNIKVNVLPAAVAGIDKNVCVGTSTQIGGTQNVANTYTWSPTTNLSSAFIANPIASPTTNTTYILTVTNSTTGCMKKDTVMLTSLYRPAKPAFNAVAPGSTGIQCEGTPVTLNATATGAASVLWYKNNTPLYYKVPSFDAVITAANATTDYYKIKSKGANGCFSVASDSVAVLIKSAPIPTITATAPASKTGTVISIPCVTGATTGTAALSGPSAMNAYTWQQLVSGAYNDVATGMSYTANVATTANNKVFRLVVTYPNACSRASVNNTVKLLTGCKAEDEKGGNSLISNELSANSDELIINAYPNPTHDLLHIDITNYLDNEGEIVLYNALGQVVMTKNIMLSSGKANETIDFHNLAAGFYSLTFAYKVVKIVKE